MDVVRLLAEVTHKNQRALAELYRYFAPGLQRIALRIVRSRECAQEVVGDVFLYVWQNAGQYAADRGSVAAWLRVLTRSRAIDSLRRNARHHPPDPTDREQAMVWDHRHPEQLAADSQQEGLLHSALSALTPMRQQLLRLAFFDGLSHDQIAAASGLSLGTVKSHVRRAMLSMRSVLASA